MKNYEREQAYLSALSAMLRTETVSSPGQTDLTKFFAFHDLLKRLFPHIFSVCEMELFNGGFLLRWQGQDPKKLPVLLMNHHDTVAAEGNWTHDPFGAEVADGKLWSRGTLDNKGGLCCLLAAADELAAENFVPACDVYFFSACTEETDGSNADLVSKTLQERGLRFAFVLDEGGMIVREPLPGAQGTFAMIGVAEKGSADLKFTARSHGGHASTPGKNTPLVRLGKFMAAAEQSGVFTAQLSPVVAEMFRRIAPCVQGPLKGVYANSAKLKPLLTKALPAVSPSAGAMLRTTIAFTMAHGSEAHNVLPQAAYVIGNMRYSHHQSLEASTAAIAKLAKKYDIETEVLNKGFPSHVSDFHSDAFQHLERAVGKVFPDVITSPYMMTGCSDCRFFSRVSDNCLRFTPFIVDNAQLATVHGVDENVDVSCLVPAVDFYRELIITL